MADLHLTVDEVLTTTRTVRRRLDLTRPVEPEVISECVRLAIQAPTGGNAQNWGFVVVTDPAKRQALGDIYRKGWQDYLSLPINNRPAPAVPTERHATLQRIRGSSDYLAEHMSEVPVLVVPCIRGRTEGMPVFGQAGVWGSILPAVWSFMLAARSRGLGSAFTTVHLFHEQEAADVLGIPSQKVMQVGLVPVAYTLGTDFSPAAREPVERVLHWEGW